jgi:hypothetical protein
VRSSCGRSTTPGCRSSRSPTATASAGRRSTTASRRRRTVLMKAAVDEADRQDRRADAARPREPRTTSRRPRPRRVGDPHRHALHRGRHLRTALRLARELGLETVGFLMMAHTVAPDVLAAQARIMADAGCQCVYVVDSAGAMILDDVTERVAVRGRARRRRPGRVPRPREPVARRGQHDPGDPRRRRAGRRLDPPLRRRLGQHPARRWPRSASGSASAPARRAEDDRRRRGRGAPGHGRRVRARPPGASSWATPASTRASSSTPTGPPSATTCPAPRS